jgi:hypothetical protein
MHVLVKLLRGATRSPSGLNGQLREIYIVGGEALKVPGEACIGQFRQYYFAHLPGTAREGYLIKTALEKKNLPSANLIPLMQDK